MKTNIVVWIASLLLINAVAIAEASEKIAWDMTISDPAFMKVKERVMDVLPLSGKVSHPYRYWSSDFWSKKRGGINYRWNAERPVGLNLRSPSKEQALSMSSQELSTLAATEKLDLLSGDYNYSLKSEIAKYADRKAPSWEGICNGWSEAATHHNEPVPVTLTSVDGIQIPFGSSDIKALLSWYYFRKSSDGYARVGGRCRKDEDEQRGRRRPRGERRDNCKNDLNAGTFHLVLTNRIGLEGESFIADIDRGDEVWNHTAFDYKTTIKEDHMRPRRSAARGTKKVMRVKTSVRYTFTLKKNLWEPALGTDQQNFVTRHYEYLLEIDAAGAIIGGEWLSKERPDFLWQSSPAKEFSGNMARLADLLAAQPQY